MGMVVLREEMMISEGGCWAEELEGFGPQAQPQ